MVRPLTPERFVYELAACVDPQISPDGRSILYGLGRADEETGKATSQLWRSDIDGGGARRLTWHGERNAGGRWSPDGSEIAFASDRLGSDRHALLLMPADGGEAREVTRLATPIGGLAWSPDGRTIAFTAPPELDVADRSPSAAPAVRATRRIDYKQDNRENGGYLGDARAQIWLVDVASGARRMLTHGSNDHHFPQWAPDGKRLAVAVPNRNGMCSQLKLVDAASGEVELVGPELGVVGCWSWSPSGDRILMAAEPERTWQLDLFVYEVGSRCLQRLTDDLPILPDAGYPTLSPPSQPVWLDDRRVLLHALREGASGIYIIDTASGAVELLQRWPAVGAGLSVDRERRLAVQAHARVDGPAEVAVTDLRTGEGTLVTAVNRAVLAESLPARWERLLIRRDPFEIEAWLLLPPNLDPSRRYPVVLDVHGGPNNFHGHRFGAVQQCLATNGFLVVAANPRGSSTYGRRFTQQVIGDWGGEDYLDLMAVLEAVLERPEADADRVGIYGFSYGGYMTAWAIGQSDRFQATVCGAPVFDFSSFYGTSDIGHVFGPMQWGRRPSDDPAWCAARSPAGVAHRARTPTLILHGEADQRCPIGQGEQMFVALLDAGCEVEFVRYPGGSHLFLSSGAPEHRRDFLQRTLGWFKTYLGEPTEQRQP
ncbi:MAG: S9 family peptidase [Chloroflexota bacterium]|nr:S9 family peptidase [Chloroflexota bacterium]